MYEQLDHSDILFCQQGSYEFYMDLRTTVIVSIQHQYIAFVTEAQSVYCVVRTGSWIQTYFRP